MRFLTPGALFLALSSLAILVLALLRSDIRRRDVAALFLWETLPSEPRSSSIHLRRLLEPLLFLQILCLVLLVAVLAQPVASSRVQRISALAIVVDASASMQTVTEGGATRYDVAIERALAIVDESPAEYTAVVFFSSNSTLETHETVSKAPIRSGLSASRVTWNGDGSADDLVNALSAAGGLDRFDRVVLITDHELLDAPDGVETIGISGGRNVAITAFSVRENVGSSGATAFVQLINATETYQDVSVVVSDGYAQTTIPVLLSPAVAENVIVPFPVSTGSVFTVTMRVEDSFVGDNTRYFALDRPLDLRVWWVGETNQYLWAALRASTPISSAASPEDADLIVVYDAQIPSTLSGAILLVHGDIYGEASVAGEAAGGPVQALATDNALLEGVEPADLRVGVLPNVVDVPNDAQVLLECGSLPLLVTWQTAIHNTTLITPTLDTTNLPITVDFPILVRNIVRSVVRLPAELSYRTAVVGEVVSLSGYGAIDRIEDPDGEELAPALAVGDAFYPDRPGVYTIHSSRGTFPVAANIAFGDSMSDALAAANDEPFANTTYGLAEREYWLPIWPLAASLIVGLLIIETVIRNRKLIRWWRGARG